MAGGGGVALRRVVVPAAGDDHVFDPVLDVDETLAVHRARVARMEPAVANRRGSVLFLAPVAPHRAGASIDDLADLAIRHLAVVGVDDPELLAEAGPAAAQKALAGVLLVLQERDGAGGLGQSVHLREAAAKRLNRPLQQLRRDG